MAIIRMTLQQRTVCHVIFINSSFLIIMTFSWCYIILSQTWFELFDSSLSFLYVCAHVQDREVKFNLNKV